ncbi:MAG: glyceraldehyde-3-phosphate:ferredoxin oxidoreductase [Candidatus Altiarchaeota archaeon]|nr:glyceraldehyde-3-phosphate:ferredoxin oxidoreductase [Candidatus Altiarchaeota archaeon]
MAGLITIMVKAVFIDAGKESYRTRQLKALGPIDAGLEVHKQAKSHDKSVFHEDNALVFGTGKFAGLGLFGTHRLTFVFRSPMSHGLHFSSLGGAGFHWYRTGQEIAVIKGRSRTPKIVVIRDTGIDFLEIDKTELFGLWQKQGIHSLNDWTARHLDFPFRGIYVGPAALKTQFACLYSPSMVAGKPDKGSEDVAGRGGAGSVLYRAHGLVGIAFGGKKTRKAKATTPELKKLVEQASGKSYLTAVQESTAKYRYDSALKTGGTFGSNYPGLKVYTPMFNWSMIYMPKKEREKQWKRLMGDKWWAQFNKEVIKTKSWKTCGEPCPVACKKVWNGIKVDYEPFEANGPLSWIFDFASAAKLVQKTDQLGYDSIEFGSTLAWLFEGIRDKLIDPADLAIDKPDFSNSAQLSKLGQEIAHNLAYSSDELYELLQDGRRSAGKKIPGMLDKAVYVPYGRTGYMSPTMYWAIGNLVPIPIQGRYCTYYKFAVFIEPEELAKKSWERAVGELWLDNLGFCRFHRGWAEPIMGKLLKKAWGIDIELEQMAKQIWGGIIKYNKKAGAEPQFWDSQRTKDLISLGAIEFGSADWAPRFKHDQEDTLWEYWNWFQQAFQDQLKP